jgi:hypothetical protein
MRSIYKYELQVIERQILSLPEGFNILCVQLQRGIPYIWANVDLQETNIKQVTINTYCTGEIISDVYEEYIGTYQMETECLVYHVFADLDIK